LPQVPGGAARHPNPLQLHQSQAVQQTPPGAARQPTPLQLHQSQAVQQTVQPCVWQANKQMVMSPHDQLQQQQQHLQQHLLQQQQVQQQAQPPLQDLGSPLQLEAAAQVQAVVGAWQADAAGKAWSAQ